MSLRERVQRLFRRRPHQRSHSVGDSPARAVPIGDLPNWFPPTDVHDPHAWDDYWRRQLQSEYGLMEAGFGDMMASDPSLIPLLRTRRCRTVLCVGNGFSSEAIALAMYGFEVTVLDLSSVPGDEMRGWFERPDHPLRRIPGWLDTGGGRLTFGPLDQADEDMRPPIHRGDGQAVCGGGAVSFVSADLADSAVCSGPFDVVIERRTVQLFPIDQRPAALECLERRLATPGVSVSQEHCGGWKPSDPRTHYAESWVVSRGFTLQSHGGTPTVEAAPRLACLRYTTG